MLTSWLLTFQNTRLLPRNEKRLARISPFPHRQDRQNLILLLRSAAATDELGTHVNGVTFRCEQLHPTAVVAALRERLWTDSRRQHNRNGITTIIIMHLLLILQIPTYSLHLHLRRRLVAVMAIRHQYHRPGHCLKDLHPTTVGGHRNHTYPGVDHERRRRQMKEALQVMTLKWANGHEL
jgi:hypothetical protein